MTQTLDFKSYTIALCQSIFKVEIFLTAVVKYYSWSQFGIIIINTETKSENMWVIWNKVIVELNEIFKIYIY